MAFFVFFASQRLEVWSLWALVLTQSSVSAPIEEGPILGCGEAVRSGLFRHWTLGVQLNTVQQHLLDAACQTMGHLHEGI